PGIRGMYVGEAFKSGIVSIASALKSTVEQDALRSLEMSPVQRAALREEHLLGVRQPICQSFHQSTCLGESGVDKGQIVIVMSIATCEGFVGRHIPLEKDTRRDIRELCELLGKQFGDALAAHRMVPMMGIDNDNDVAIGITNRL